MRRRWWIVGAVLVLALAGCGSKKSSSPPAQTATSSSSSSSAASSSSSSSSGSSSSRSSSFASTKNCAQLASLASKVASSLAPSGNQATDLKNEEKAFDALGAAVPDEIKGDFKTFSDAFKKFVDTITSAGVTSGATPSAAQLQKLQEASKAFSTPKLQLAEKHLSAWAQKNCGLSSSTTP